MEKEQSVVHPSELTHVPTAKIHTNPHNPRLLFHEKPLKILRDSIAEVGILVPLLIYQRKTDGEYVILDGERRWLCARELDLETVPANIIEEPTKLGNLLYMFNIHNVRESWELMPTALKLEVIIRELDTDSEIQLSELTGLTRMTVRRCKTLLKYDKNYQDMMLAVDPEQRVKADFFIEMYPVLNLIDRKLHVIATEFTRNQLIEAFLAKYRRQEMTNVLDFRKIADFIRSIGRGVPAELVESSLLNFLKGKSTLDKYFEQVDIMEEAQTLKRSCESLIRKIYAFEPARLSDQEMRNVLLKLRTLIDEKLESMPTS